MGPIRTRKEIFTQAVSSWIKISSSICTTQKISLCLFLVQYGRKKLALMMLCHSIMSIEDLKKNMLHLSLLIALSYFHVNCFRVIFVPTAIPCWKSWASPPKLESRTLLLSADVKDNPRSCA